MTEWWVYQVVKLDDMFSHFDTIPVYDGRTDILRHLGPASLGIYGTINLYIIIIICRLVKTVTKCMTSK